MTSITQRFITNLKSFNRKERFFLVGWALGNRGFKLSPAFRRELSSSLDLDVPAETFGAMDYHLDWIYASAFLAAAGDAEAVHPNGDGLINGNQEDVDLVVAYEGEDGADLIMVEAKGVTGWTNEQLNSKAKRLQAIFGQNGEHWPCIRPHFLLASPGESGGLDCSRWPGWMKRADGRPYWARMDIPSGLLRVTRCDERGEVSAGGEYWKLAGSRRR